MFELRVSRGLQLKFCPQCGRRTAFSSTAASTRTRTDAEGFCAPYTSSDGYQRALSPEATGCPEHLRRFDAETGARLGGLPVTHVRAWEQSFGIDACSHPKTP